MEDSQPPFAERGDMRRAGLPWPVDAWQKKSYWIKTDVVLPRKARQLEEKVGKACALPNLDVMKCELQTVCDKCQSNPASFCYELFSAKRLVKGSCCAGCFLDLLRGLWCTDGDAGAL